jgi:hypothetical protein
MTLANRSGVTGRKLNENLCEMQRIIKEKSQLTMQIHNDFAAMIPFIQLGTVEHRPAPGGLDAISWKRNS